MEEEKQVAVVTGAGRGIGRAICIELARRGFHVVVNYGHQKEAAEEVVQKCRQFGVQAVAVKADMSQKADCDFLMKEALKLTGKVQVWVNNAGITRDNLLLRMSEEEFQKDELKTLILKIENDVQIGKKNKNTAKGDITAVNKFIEFNITRTIF